MPCSCEGYPPSPCFGDLIGSAEDAIRKIRELEYQLKHSTEKTAKLKQELHALKEAFKIVGNGG